MQNFLSNMIRSTYRKLCTNLNTYTYLNVSIKTFISKFSMGNNIIVRLIQFLHISFQVRSLQLSIIILSYQTSEEEEKLFEMKINVMVKRSYKRYYHYSSHGYLGTCCAVLTVLYWLSITLYIQFIRYYNYRQRMYAQYISISSRILIFSMKENCTVYQINHFKVKSHAPRIWVKL